MSCGVGHRYSWDPVLLWLRCRLAATALIRPTTWELPYAMDVTLKSKKEKEKKKEKERNEPPNPTLLRTGSQSVSHVSS